MHIHRNFSTAPHMHIELNNLRLPHGLRMAPRGHHRANVNEQNDMYGLQNEAKILRSPYGLCTSTVFFLRPPHIHYELTNLRFPCGLRMVPYDRHTANVKAPKWAKWHIRPSKWSPNTTAAVRPPHDGRHFFAVPVHTLWVKQAMTPYGPRTAPRTATVEQMWKHPKKPKINEKEPFFGHFLAITKKIIKIFNFGLQIRIQHTSKLLYSKN